ncbi:MotA/TolQ/ExbB proton channel family protein [Salibacteraceae bacterium]|jgi:biopolymer transport protein ExbB|nr:MotA/TolQ/ExbB proton channel family protein [Bacteroidota bacterium]MDB9724933.1 MotA/TolQ/ExbB proton channel family protein [Salibacteraceae bacterium]MDB9984034.1 MotA/TolQ/ExbB proton channel family protein [bacterium]
MNKVFSILAVFALLNFGYVSNSYAQEENTEATTEEATSEEVVDDSTTEAVTEEQMVEEEPMEEAAPVEEEEAAPEKSFHQVVKDKFIAGGPGFMSFVLVCLILGLAICIERILYLTMATTNTKQLVENVEAALKSGGVEAAKEVCRNTKGPVASIFYQGLDRSSEGIDMVEKSVVAYGSVQMGLMEKGLSWISLFIALAPMLGFFGTVVGMIGAFDAIAEANNISPGIVAGGIGVALITTVSGLLVAMVLQVFYNYIVAKVDSIVNDMEDASISLVDLLIKHQTKA